MGSLPKLDLPWYKHHLVGLDKDIKYRPFTVKEQKILLRAKESNDAQDMVDAMKQITELCTQDVVADELPFFDLEDIFLRIRTKSVSEVSEIGYKVKDTDEKISVQINLDEVVVKQLPEHEKKIMLTDTVGVVMKYPTLEMLSGEATTDEDMILNCIDYVFDESEVYHFHDVSKQEAQEWVEDFDTSVMLKIHKFFETMPRLRHEVEIELKDGTKETIKFEGIQDLFT